MSSRTNRFARLTLALALCALATAAVSCKSSGLAQIEPPTAESLTLAACEHFEQNGYAQDDSGVFHSDAEDFVLFQQPTHIIRVNSDDYPFQGIMTREATLKTQHNAKRVYLVIMWWSADQNKWVHLTGSDIPKIDYGLQP